MATTARVCPLSSPGATTSFARTWTFAVSWESDRAAADSTPASRSTASTPDHPTSAGSVEPGAGAGTTTLTEVAVRASKRPTIWFAAVDATPIVITSVPMPSTVPSVVRAERTGRASTPASDSAHRSRGSIQGRSGRSRRPARR